MQIRKATIEDIQAIRNIAVTAWESTYRSIIPPEVQQSFLDHAYSNEMLSNRMDNTLFFLAICENKIVGFINYFVTKNDLVELSAFYIDPLFQRKGIGTQLFEKMIGECKVGTEIVCDVETDNAIGMSFYQKKGFRIEKQYVDHFLGHDLKTTRMRYKV
ncbi:MULTISPECIES: GNAT family N-acetyltransferase [unclassified Paenibacillus]|uniref:GNAT family N-acetyltransferase n=1 Tax=unclassified Paenibacillus TaxID=185978 RepID=UPI001C10C1A4|nr:MULTISPECIES: N-acetyltransferase [unclassified Paenibacillus]MBU5441391.1 GNAT family N-acetyltransferase [Paenibacillus sp. MSJ-34]CAH0118257.1 Spermidine/spermine N(1)-acetyltransferase [Paenibacillus sp. CECT 9249]